MLAIGVRRTTLAEVARRAGVSRMTLYRRHPDARGLLAALMTREFGDVVRRAHARASTVGTARGRLVAAAVEVARELSGNPLMRAVLDMDPATVLPYIVERLGGTQRLAEQVLREHIADGHRDGSIRAGDPATQARALFLVVQSFVLSSRPATSDVDSSALFGELSHLLDAGLRDRHRHDTGAATHARASR